MTTITRTILTAAFVALAAPAMAQGYWSQQQGSIYSHAAPAYQWNDRSNAGELYTPPARQYVQPSTSCTSQQIGFTVFTNCN